MHELRTRFQDHHELGHVNNDYKMADIYIDIDYSICDKANRAVLDLLQKKEEKKT